MDTSQRERMVQCVNNSKDQLSDTINIQQGLRGHRYLLVMAHGLKKGGGHSHSLGTNQTEV
eukprot:12935815-Prorocentrum_lima.AAC.1